MPIYPVGSIAALIETYLATFGIELLQVDKDIFDVVDADANTERWTPAYLSGAEGGSANINTTVAGKLMIKVDPDATPTAAMYAVARELSVLMKNYMTWADFSYAWGTLGAGESFAGIIVGGTSAYDANNRVICTKNKSNAVERITVNAFFNAVEQGAITVNTVDDAIALKVERNGNIWRCYYSTLQGADVVWNFVAQFEDPSNFMTDTSKIYLVASSAGAADAETIQVNVDDWYLANTFGVFSDKIGNSLEGPTAPGVMGSVHSKIRGIMQALGVVAAAAGTGFEIDGGPNLVDSVGLEGEAATADDLSDVATTSLMAKVRRALVRMSPDAFTATIQGGARTELDTMFAQLATYFSAAGAAMALQVNGQAARTNLEQALLDFFAAFGCDAANVFNPTVQGAVRTDLDTALYNMATYFSALGAVYSATVNPGGTAKDNVEQTLEDLGDVLAGTGIVTYPVAAAPADGVSIAEALRATYDQVIKALGTAPSVGSVIGNWQSGAATSGEVGADLIAFGADNVRNKVHALLVSLHLLGAASLITVRMYMQVNGVERKWYEQTYDRATATAALPIINGTIGIHEVVRVEVRSNTVADDGLAIHYDLMLEAM